MAEEIIQLRWLQSAPNVKVKVQIDRQTDRQVDRKTEADRHKDRQTGPALVLCVFVLNLRGLYVQVQGEVLHTVFNFGWLVKPKKWKSDEILQI